MKEHELKELMERNLPRMDGPDREEALREFRELPKFVVPTLIEMYEASDDAHRRGKLVETIWEIRDPDCLNFLFNCLMEAQEREVWDQALNGIVTLGREPEMDRLIELKNHMDDDVKIARTIEAIEFIGALISNKKHEYIVYHGVRMIKGWEKKIEKAQTITEYTIGDKIMPRVKFGQEQVMWDTAHPCEICGVLKGQYHIPGCNHEECPNCGEEAMICRCADELMKEK